EGVVRRRHLLCEGRRLLAIDDEVFDDEALTERERSGLRGEAALMAALQRRRTGRMADIVATIQVEQDEIIRAPLEGALLVQGRADMVHVLGRAVRTRQRVLREEATVALGAVQLMLTPRASRAARQRARASGLPHNRAKAVFDGVVVGELLALAIAKEEGRGRR